MQEKKREKKGKFMLFAKNPDKLFPWLKSPTVKSTAQYLREASRSPCVTFVSLSPRVNPEGLNEGHTVTLCHKDSNYYIPVRSLDLMAVSEDRLYNTAVQRWPDSYRVFWALTLCELDPEQKVILELWAPHLLCDGVILVSDCLGDLHGVGILDGQTLFTQSKVDADVLRLAIKELKTAQELYATCLDATVESQDGLNVDISETKPDEVQS
jgi:hypothetical protein